MCCLRVPRGVAVEAFEAAAEVPDVDASGGTAQPASEVPRRDASHLVAVNAKKDDVVAAVALQNRRGRGNTCALYTAVAAHGCACSRGSAACLQPRPLIPHLEVGREATSIARWYHPVTQVVFGLAACHAAVLPAGGVEAVQAHLRLGVEQCAGFGVERRPATGCKSEPPVATTTQQHNRTCWSAFLCSNSSRMVGGSCGGAALSTASSSVSNNSSLGRMRQGASLASEA